MGKAVKGGLVEIAVVDFRKHGLGRHHNVDDVPYGGGAGMVLRPEPIFAAVRERKALHAAEGRKTRTVLLTPQGRPFRQVDAVAFAALDETLLFVCGRYEGFDERIRTGLADEEVSLGDFVCLGGETPVMVMLEAIVRLLPVVLGNPESSAEESFAQGLLEYPQYTRPPEFEGMPVPEVLLSGHHAEIARWREDQARQRTAARRPDLTGAAPEPEAPKRRVQAGRS
jgi:tRNA (guanine37-N1)-methyltransferase